MLAVPFDFRARRASGSVTLAWVSLLRFCPRQSRAWLRPGLAGGDAGPTGAEAKAPGGGVPASPDGGGDFGWNDLWLAQAWISVPSTEKCSSDISARTRGCVMIAVSSCCATSPSSSRSRFLLKVLASHTGASID